MTQPTERERAASVQRMFTRLAPRYDRMNRLMTGFQDVRWRRLTIQHARLMPGASLLDLGAGTGDLAREALRQFPQARVTAADFSLAMMRVGQRNGTRLDWSAADALHLPFAESAFDVVVSGFLVRNAADLHKCLQEQYRVLARGGRIVILDTTRPKKNLFSPLIGIYMCIVIPTLGGWVAGLRGDYKYLPESTLNFVTAERLAALMASVGFRKIGFKRLMFGTVALHWAEK